MQIDRETVSALYLKAQDEAIGGQFYLHFAKLVAQRSAEQERARCAELCRKSDRYRGEYFAQKIEENNG